MTHVFSDSGTHEIFDRGSYREEITVGREKDGVGAFCKFSWKNKASSMKPKNKKEKKDDKS